MYTLFRIVGLRAALVAEAGPIGVSFITAEAFYKFHSFTLECAAFLATWIVASWCWSGIRHRIVARKHNVVTESP